MTNGSNKKLKMKTWAICVEHAKTTYATVSNGIPVFLDNTQDSLGTGACSIAQYGLTGLGATVLGFPAGTEIASLEPTDLDADTVRDDGVTAYFNNQSGANQKMSVTAICTKL